MSVDVHAKQSERIGRDDGSPELTVERMFRGLPAVGLDDPHRAVQDSGRRIELRLPRAMLAAVRHY
jgi:hypothetical protein